MKNKHLIELNVSEIYNIYFNHLVNDFESSRIKDFQDILSMITEGSYQFIGYKRHGNLVGYAAIAKSPIDNCALLDYFAIFDEYRHQGYGHKFLKELKNELSDLTCLLCDITQDEFNTLSHLYPDFYQKLGTIDANMQYTKRNQTFMLVYFPVINKKKKTKKSMHKGRAKANFLAIVSKLNPKNYLKLKENIK